MEEKKDINSLIGFTLMGGVMLLWLWMQPPLEETVVSDNENPTNEMTDNEPKSPPAFVDKPVIDYDSSSNKNANDIFNESQVNNSEVITHENDLIFLEVSSKGGFISTLYLKNFTNHLEQPIYLINNEDEQSVFNLNFKQNNNSQNVNSKNLIFESSKVENDGNTVIVMKHTVSDDQDQYLEYRYTIKPNDYMIDFSINSNGLRGIVNTQDNYELTWDYKSLRNSKSISYENRYSRLTYEYETDKIDKLGQTGDDEETISELNWFSYRQHFFSAILLSSKPLNKVKLSQINMAIEDIDTIYTKRYKSNMGRIDTVHGAHSLNDLVNNINRLSSQWDDIIKPIQDYKEATLSAAGLDKVAGANISHVLLGLMVTFVADLGMSMDQLKKQVEFTHKEPFIKIGVVDKYAPIIENLPEWMASYFKAIGQV